MADLYEGGGVRPGTTKFVRPKKKPPKPPAFTASADAVAQQFGFKLAFINSDPQLKAMFGQFMQEYIAAEGQIAPERFKLMLDQWADKANVTASWVADRKLELEQPEDWAQAVSAEVSVLKEYAQQIGADVTDRELWDAAVNARRMGMNEVQKRSLIQGYVDAVYSGDRLDFAGEAGVSQDDIMEWASNNGVRLSDNMVTQYIQDIATGKTTLDEIKSDIRQTYMAGAFPAWSDRIMAGMDIADIAAPYKSTMAQLLEVDENAIDFGDPLMMAGLQSVGEDGKPRVMPIYEYQNLIRKDPRWQKTDNAYATYANVAQNLLRTFGFA